MKTNRLYFIDAVRAFAILMMLQGHFIDTLLDPIYKDDSYVAYNIWSYFRGITAPTFFTISGLVFSYLLIKVKKLLIKKIFNDFVYFLVGYVLNTIFIFL